MFCMNEKASEAASGVQPASKEMTNPVQVRTRIPFSRRQGEPAWSHGDPERVPVDRELGAVERMSRGWLWGTEDARSTGPSLPLSIVRQGKIGCSDLRGKLLGDQGSGRSKYMNIDRGQT